MCCGDSFNVFRCFFRLYNPKSVRHMENQYSGKRNTRMYGTLDIMNEKLINMQWKGLKVRCQIVKLTMWNS